MYRYGYGSRSSDIVRFAARNFATSTRAWRAERTADTWATRAGQEGLRSRAAYKLLELNDQFGKFLRPGVNVVDLGAAPGGFSVVAAQLVNPRIDAEDWKLTPVSEYEDDNNTNTNTNSNSMDERRAQNKHQQQRTHGRVVCVDLQEMEEVPGAVFVHGDARSCLGEIRRGLGGMEADVIMSDMAPKTSCDPYVSHVKSVELAECALDIAGSTLRDGGTLVVKVLMGEELDDLRGNIEKQFVHTRTLKPKASKKKSKEQYIVAQGFVSKLAEINDRFGKFLRPGVYVVDLGAAPGRFSAIAAQLVKPRIDADDWRITPVSEYEDIDINNNNSNSNINSMDGRQNHHQRKRAYGRVVCVDTEEMEEVAGAVFVQGEARRSIREIRKALGGNEADVIIADLAPEDCTDPFEAAELARYALDVAESTLRNGGTLVVKIVKGKKKDLKELRCLIEQRFVHTRTFKPKAAGKKEQYIVAQRFVKITDRTEPHMIDQVIDIDSNNNCNSNSNIRSGEDDSIYSTSSEL